MSVEPVIEEVPHFIRRIGDRVIEGSNNCLMILGTDRANTVDSGLGHAKAADNGKGAGSVHFIAGRSSENVNFGTDKSFLYLSMKTDVDENLDLNSIEFTSSGLASAVLKSDAVRIVGRKDIKLVTDGGTYITANDDEISINTKSKIVIKVGGSVMTMKKDGSITIEGTSVKLGPGTVGQNPLVNGVVLASGIDTFTGVAYGVLGQASAAVMAGK